MTDHVIIYTDGACKGNPGPGGWGVILSYKGTVKEIYGGDPDTTNNCMELMAAIQSLETLTKPCPCGSIPIRNMYCKALPNG